MARKELSALNLSDRPAATPEPAVSAAEKGLRVRNIARAFGQRQVVSDVSLTVQRGEVAGLLGPNGAGKTTCFYMITGLIPPDSGTISILGKDMMTLSKKDFAWYHRNHGVDVRSLRYPGLISWKTLPGGGTTDYAVEIFHAALKQGQYTSYLAEGTALPMMYMPDAIRATLELMEAPAERLRERHSYNLAGISFTPGQLAAAIERHVPGFKMQCEPDFRQAIADSWPRSIDDQAAQADWGWRAEYDLDAMVLDMLENLRPMAVTAAQPTSS